MTFDEVIAAQTANAAEIVRLEARLARLTDAITDGGVCRLCEKRVGFGHAPACPLVTAAGLDNMLLPIETVPIRPGLFPGDCNNDTGYHRLNTDGTCSDCGKRLVDSASEAQP